MDENTRIGLLKKGGKKALAEYNRLNRVTGPDMNLGTRVHADERYKSQSTKTGLLIRTDKNLPEGAQYDAPFLFAFARTGKAVFLFGDELPTILPCRVSILIS